MHGDIAWSITNHVKSKMAADAAVAIAKTEKALARGQCYIQEDPSCSLHSSECPTPLFWSKLVFRW